MQWILAFIKTLIASWFAEKRKDSAIEDLKALLKQAEDDLENAKKKHNEALEAGLSIGVRDWSMECRRLSANIWSLRSRIGECSSQ